MYSVPDVDVQQAPEMLDGDSEFLKIFEQEDNTDESISIDK